MMITLCDTMIKMVGSKDSIFVTELFKVYVKTGKIISGTLLMFHMLLRVSHRPFMDSFAPHPPPGNSLREEQPC